jgi:hypothetical protein
MGQKLFTGNLRDGPLFPMRPDRQRIKDAHRDPKGQGMHRRRQSRTTRRPFHRAPA